MEDLTRLLTWQNITAIIGGYCVTVAIYRVYLHPLARFPGPKLAAVTRWYEGYYDLYKPGQYVFKIKEMHDKYGPIIRISPHELHVNDPNFYNTLYSRDGEWHKYDWSVDAFSTKAAIWTADHNVHKGRRRPLSPYFSKAKVSDQEDMIMSHVHRLFDRLALFVPSHETFDLGAAFGAFVRDVINNYIFGKHYGDIDKEDFDAGMTVAAQAGGLLWRTTKFIRFFGPVVKSIPPQIIMRNTGDRNMKNFFQFMMMVKDDTKALMKAAESPDANSHPTLVRDIAQSNLPQEEKEVDRIFDEMSTTTGAGYETTAAVLRLAAFHIYSNPSILKKLREEVVAAPDQTWKSFEQLPYLTAVIMEAMRLAPALATRSARIAPDRDIWYKSWSIPAGTPVGMTVFLVHMNEDDYPEPKSFNPDRWMNPDPWHLGDRVFVPFSKGSRNCVGMHLAWAEIYLLLGNLVRRFDFNFPSTKADDFHVIGDNFALMTGNMGVVPAKVTDIN